MVLSQDEKHVILADEDGAICVLEVREGVENDDDDDDDDDAAPTSLLASKPKVSR